MAMFSSATVKQPERRCTKCGGKLRARPPKDNKQRYHCQSCHTVWEQDTRGQLKETV